MEAQGLLVTPEQQQAAAAAALAAAAAQPPLPQPQPTPQVLPTQQSGDEILRRWQELEAAAAAAAASQQAQTSIFLKLDKARIGDNR